MEANSRLCRQRNKNIEDALQSAENAKKEMENLTADNEKILAEAKAQEI